MGLVYSMGTVTSASNWLLNKMAATSYEELTKICTGVVRGWWWFWRNKKVWESKSTNPAVAMQRSFTILDGCRKAKQVGTFDGSRSNEVGIEDKKWKCPKEGTLKVNVDASVFPNAVSFSIGMVLRNHMDEFLEGKNMASPPLIMC